MALEKNSGPASFVISNATLSGTVGNKNYWAGGVNDQSNNYTSLVEIRGAVSGSSTFNCLMRPNAFFSTVQKKQRDHFLYTWT